MVYLFPSSTAPCSPSLLSQTPQELVFFREKRALSSRHEIYWTPFPYMPLTVLTKPSPSSSFWLYTIWDQNKIHMIFLFFFIYRYILTPRECRLGNKTRSPPAQQILLKRGRFSICSEKWSLVWSLQPANHRAVPLAGPFFRFASCSKNLDV